ncbi:unnamed protein product [Acanthoscelides obtectus]|uniref:Uncharacterized protein n=1 Tax=Acanthoscelides obtectus TaxID=200917 RepID=A0A9P0K3F3_ACAOB|nr:unnamed protein product [Acanthoscelides obtectus]CAK1634260.1 hypothetical protein AOBTE_LOCUS8700 [Acanthoscelides obtectus]
MVRGVPGNFSDSEIKEELKQRRSSPLHWRRAHGFGGRESAHE